MDGEDVRQWREQRGLSLRQLAPMLGVAAYSIHRWEQGISPVPSMLELALNGLACKLKNQEGGTGADA